MGAARASPGGLLSVVGCTSWLLEVGEPECVCGLVLSTTHLVYSKPTGGHTGCDRLYIHSHFELHTHVNMTYVPILEQTTF